MVKGRGLFLTLISLVLSIQSVSANPVFDRVFEIFSFRFLENPVYAIAFLRLTFFLLVFILFELAINATERFNARSGSGIGQQSLTKYRKIIAMILASWTFFIPVETLASQLGFAVLLFQLIIPVGFTALMFILAYKTLLKGGSAWRHVGRFILLALIGSTILGTLLNSGTSGAIPGLGVSTNSELYEEIGQWLMALLIFAGIYELGRSLWSLKERTDEEVAKRLAKTGGQIESAGNKVSENEAKAQQENERLKQIIGQLNQALQNNATPQQARQQVSQAESANKEMEQALGASEDELKRLIDIFDKEKKEHDKAIEKNDETIKELNAEIEGLKTEKNDAETEEEIQATIEAKEELLASLEALKQELSSKQEEAFGKIQSILTAITESNKAARIESSKNKALIQQLSDKAVTKEQFSEIISALSNNQGQVSNLFQQVLERQKELKNKINELQQQNPVIEQHITNTTTVINQVEQVEIAGIKSAEERVKKKNASLQIVRRLRISFRRLGRKVMRDASKVVNAKTIKKMYEQLTNTLLKSYNEMLKAVNEEIRLYQHMIQTSNELNKEELEKIVNQLIEVRESLAYNVKRVLDGFKSELESEINKPGSDKEKLDKLKRLKEEFVRVQQIFHHLRDQINRIPKIPKIKIKVPKKKDIKNKAKQRRKAVSFWKVLPFVGAFLLTLIPGHSANMGRPVDNTRQQGVERIAPQGHIIGRIMLPKDIVLLINRQDYREAHATINFNYNSSEIKSSNDSLLKNHLNDINESVIKWKGFKDEQEYNNLRNEASENIVLNIAVSRSVDGGSGRSERFVGNDELTGQSALKVKEKINILLSEYEGINPELVKINIHEVTNEERLTILKTYADKIREFHNKHSEESEKYLDLWNNQKEIIKSRDKLDEELAGLLATVEILNDNGPIKDNEVVSWLEGQRIAIIFVYAQTFEPTPIGIPGQPPGIKKHEGIINPEIHPAQRESKKSKIERENEKPIYRPSNINYGNKGGNNQRRFFHR